MTFGKLFTYDQSINQSSFICSLSEPLITNLVPAKRQWCILAWQVTIGLASQTYWYTNLRA